MPGGREAHPLGLQGLLLNEWASDSAEEALRAATWDPPHRAAWEGTWWRAVRSELRPEAALTLRTRDAVLSLATPGHARPRLTTRGAHVDFGFLVLGTLWSCPPGEPSGRVQCGSSSASPPRAAAHRQEQHKSVGCAGLRGSLVSPHLSSQRHLPPSGQPRAQVSPELPWQRFWNPAENQKQMKPNV